MSKKIRVAIIPTIIASYRKGFYDRLLVSEDLEVTIFCQRSVAGANINCISKEYPNNVEYISYISTKSGSFSWQFLPFFRILFNFDVVIISGNPRVLSDFFFGLFLRLVNKPVVLWMMAKSYRANKTTQYLRLSWSKFFKFILTYNDNEIMFLRQNGFKNQKIVAVNNGLDQKKIDSASNFWTQESLNEWLEFKNLKGKTLILSLARLEPKNNFDLVFEALPLILDSFPNVHWCLIGSGSQFNYLNFLANKYNIQKHVSFCGPIFDEEELAPYFLNSSVFVHPGAIGLSLLHAFGYGLPVVTHNVSDLHGPEYSVFNSNINGVNFESKDHINIAKTIIGLIKDNDLRNNIKNNNLYLVRNIYNVDVMVKRLYKIILMSLNKEKND